MWFWDPWRHRDVLQAVLCHYDIVTLLWLPENCQKDYRDCHPLVCRGTRWVRLVESYLVAPPWTSNRSELLSRFHLRCRRDWTRPCKFIFVFVSSVTQKRVAQNFNDRKSGTLYTFGWARSVFGLTCLVYKRSTDSISSKLSIWWVTIER